MIDRKLALIVTVTVALAIPGSVLAQSQTRPASPGSWHAGLEIGPVPGFTTVWHPAPVSTAAPLGTVFRFRVPSPRRAAVEWVGAREVERTVWSVAEVTLTAPGRHRVSARFPDREGGTIEETIDLDVQPLPAGGIEIPPISIAVDSLDLGGVPSNPTTMNYFFRDDSIAKLTEVAPEHYRTSVERWLTLRADIEPAGFAPLVEWRLDGVPQRFLGSPVRMRVHPARSFEIAAGAGLASRQARLDTYRVRITSHARRGPLPEAERITFEAVTDPPGHEDEITWLASTKYGTALPLTGEGAEFTTFFVNVSGGEGEWLGVRADNVTVSADSKLARFGFGDQDAGERPQLTVRPDVVCGEEVSHRLEVLWDVVNAQVAQRVEVDVVFGDGSTVTLEGGTEGAAGIPVTSPLGGSALVLMRAAPVDAGPAAAESFVRVAQTAALLPPCGPIIVPPRGEGFEPGEPPFAGSGAGEIREVEVAALDRPSTNARDKSVTAVGSGAAVQLATWVSDAGAPPVVLERSEPIAGFDVRLHALTLRPQESAPQDPVRPFVRPFVAAMRRDDGNLWLSVYSLDERERLVLHDTVGYGANAGVIVEAYGIDHRVLTRVVGAETRVVFQIVTPVLTRNGDLRLVVWEVTGARHEPGELVFTSLDLRGIQDSGNQGQAALDSPLDVAYLGADLFVVPARNAEGNLLSQFWEVKDDGEILLSGRNESAASLSGSAQVTDPLVELAIAPLEVGGYVTATSSDPLDAAELVVWEPLRFTGLVREMYEFFWELLGFLPPPPMTFPYRITDNRKDREPGRFGVDTDSLPSLTDSLDDDGDRQEVRAILTDALWETLGTGVGDLFTDGEDELTGIASLTKVMTLILALEDVAAGHVELDEPVRVSLNAFSQPPNVMGLGPFQAWALEDLLYGLILVSGGDAAVAIAEGQVHPLLPLSYHAFAFGREDLFVERMNARAEQLGMHDTNYGRARGVSNSTPRDQVKLMMHGLSDVPLFRTFMSTGRRTVESDPVLGYFAEVTIPLKKTDSDYPGLIAYKPGGGGDRHEDVTPCTSCLAAAVTRLGRTLIVVLQQSGDVVGDSNDLFDYGFRQQFTPDLRGDDGGSAGPATEFAIARQRDTAFHTEVVSAAVGGGTLEVCLWHADAGDGNLLKTGCGSEAVPSLPRGGPVATPAVELIRLSTDESAGDYLRGFLGGGAFEMDLWRVAPKRRPPLGSVPVG